MTMIPKDYPGAFWRVFTHDLSQPIATSVVVADIPWKDDDDGGLPEWYFEGEFFSLFIDPARDLVEWVPVCGPAPWWEAKFSSFNGNAAMLAAFDAWFRKTYGGENG